MVKAGNKRIMITLQARNLKRLEELCKLNDATQTQLLNELIVKEAIKKGLE